MNDLKQIQLNIEAKGILKGQKRYDERKAKAVKFSRESNTSYGSKLISLNIRNLGDAIREAKSPAKGRPVAALKPVQEVLPNVIAMVALQTVITTASKTPRSNTLSIKIAKALFHEAQREALSDSAKAHFKNTLRTNGASGADAGKTLEYISQIHSETIKPWDIATKTKLGRHLLHLVCVSTELFTLEKSIDSKGKDYEMVIATEKLIQAIEDDRNIMRDINPDLLPMVMMPREWSKENLFNGCYLSNSKAPTPFVKRKNPKQMARLLSENPIPVFDAVNRTQETGVRIRKPALKLLQTMSDNKIDLGLDVGSFPTPNDKEIDPKSPKNVQYEVRKLNKEMRNIRISFENNLSIAEEFAEFDRFYIPHHLDTRGRLYPIPSLNFQSADYVKGLLEFAEGQPLGEDGLFWIKVHTANLFGVDKVALEDRVAWVDSNLKELLASAMDPLKETFWTTADKPIQAFASCLELLGATIEGPNYVSHMPIALDGTCSGLQHLGAAFRCEVTAKAVNLIPSDKPQDIYQEVADGVTERLINSGDTLAAQWLEYCSGKVSRKITKRCVMTFPYGSKVPGFSDQLYTDFLKPDQKAGKKLPFGDIREAARYMAQHIFEVVSTTVLKAAEAMNWMQGAAAAIACANKDIEWTTPLGFPVVQDYRQTERRRVESVVQGSRLQTWVNMEKDNIDTRRMVNAIAPNVVHSLDSTHLLLTVLRASEEGIKDFALIHDSFGTHAGSTTKFFYIIRETFKELYSLDIFESLKEEFEEQVDQKIAAKKKKSITGLPTRGEYDLTNVINSLFAFC